MQITVKSEGVFFKRNELKILLENMDENVTYNVETLVYYPYLFYEFKIDSKSIFNRAGKKAGCTIDAINKIGALVDRTPQVYDEKVNAEQIMHNKLHLNEAMQIAEEFLYDSISSRMKVFKMPKLILSRKVEFFRPYWVVKGCKSLSDPYYLTVDAVTGKFHPL